jgi:hypothetical protein
MRYAVTATLFTALLAGLANVIALNSAFAEVFDGNWSVLVITEQGTCDRAYRYSVHVENGQVRYNGDANGVNLAGEVFPNGHVSVSINLRDRSARGVGRISDKVGAGSWHGNGSNNTTCSGTWEAERR